jgi:hypothetical protein
MSDQDEVTLGEVHRAVLRVEAQAVKTNGRVTKLEEWKAKIVGAWFVVSLAGPVIAGLIAARLG